MKRRKSRLQDPPNWLLITVYLAALGLATYLFLTISAKF